MEGTRKISKVKMKVFQELKQIIRPSRWTLENVESFFKGLGQIEKHKATIAGNKTFFLVLGDEVNETEIW